LSLEEHWPTLRDAGFDNPSRFRLILDSDLKVMMTLLAGLTDEFESVYGRKRKLDRGNLVNVVGKVGLHCVCVFAGGSPVHDLGSTEAAPRCRWQHAT
jgi:hypothetical protein